MSTKEDNYFPAELMGGKYLYVILQNDYDKSRN